MEKLYEKLANKINAAIYAYDEKLKEFQVAVSELQNNPRYSDIGKKELLGGINKELEKLNNEAEVIVRGAVKEFCNEYRLKSKEDGKDHQTDIANALKVIEMCGTNLTADLLRGVLEPMKGSYSSLKIVKDVLMVKSTAITTEMVGVEYSDEIKAAIYDYITSDVEIDDYNSRLKEIEDMEKQPVLFSASVMKVDAWNHEVWSVVNESGYAIYTLSDNMIAVGKKYEEISNAA